MSKNIKWLGGLLIAQLVLVLVTSTGQAGYQSHAPEGPLLSFDQNSIDKINLSDGIESLSLIKFSDGSWRLPAIESLPADPALVSEAIGKLADLQQDWPITTTPSAHDRFGVADDAYERKIDLLKGEDSLATLYLGESPGFRKVHTRVGGEDPVYSLELNSFDFPLEATSWLDKSLLAIDEPTLIKSDGFSLAKIGVDWQLEIDDSVTEHDTAKVNQLVNAISNLRITNVADSPISEQAEVVELMISAGGQDYTLYIANEGDTYWATRSDITTLFNLGQYQFTQIAAATAESLRPEPATEMTSEQGADSAEISADPQPES